MANTSSGVFAGLGGDVIVSVDIIPDPEIIEQQLFEVASQLEHTEIPMTAARRVVQEDMQAHFDSESDPDGNHWIELDNDYLRYKQAAGFPDDILHRTGKLERAATSNAAFVVTPQGLWFNWDALPKDDEGRNIGQIHQAGTMEPHMRVAHPSDEHAGEFLRFTAGAGRGNALPARPFVGMSQDAEVVVWSVFDVWADQAVDVFIHPTTGVMQYRTAGGRFGRKIRF